MTGAAPVVEANQSILVQCFEIWILDDEGQTMRLQEHVRLRGGVVDTGTSERRVRSGEGVAGMAWNQRSAVILQESPSELLQRIGTQNGLDLTALIAYPIMRGQEVLSVLVLGINADPGAIEIWSRDDRDELSISSSYYSGLKSLEFISRYVKFPKGAGLPGTVWKTGLPKLAVDLSHNATFMRSCEADETVLQTGLALPVGNLAGNSDSVLVFLSAQTTPIAHTFQIWAPGTVSEADTEFHCIASAPPVRSDDGLSTEKPHEVVLNAWTTERPVFSRLPGASSVRAVLAVPIYRGRELTSVLMFKF